MKKLILLLLFLFCISATSFAMITTDNVDRDRFLYEEGFEYTTTNLVSSLTAVEMPVIAGATNQNLYRLVKRTSDASTNGRIVALAVSGNKALTAGCATFDVTINGIVTGIQAVLQPVTISASGTSGSSGPQYSYITHDRATDVTEKGFRPAFTGSELYDSYHPYGKATGLSAGNRIGIKVTTSSDFAPSASISYVATVYVLQ